MKSMLSLVLGLAATGVLGAETIKLPAPYADSGETVIQALKARHSERAFSDRDLPLETLSGVLWAANGFNRPDKRTNATGLDKQTIMVYAIMKSGAYRYAAKENALVKVCDEDLRPAIAAQQAYAATAPVSLLVTADLSDPIYAGTRSALSNYDAGIVSGNIYLYCAANGLATVCRRSMDQDALKKALKLSDTTVLHLNHPIGYPAGKGNATSCLPSKHGGSMFVVRIAEIEVHPEWLEAYLAAAETVGAESVAKEPGVICIFPMQKKESPTSIRIVEIYRSEEAYKEHLATPHFRKYKEGTPHMIKSLKLVPMQPLDPDHADSIFKKWTLK